MRNRMFAASALMAALAMGAVAHAAEQPVTVVDNGNAWTLDNGIVRVVISKANGNIRGMQYQGTDVLAAGGSWEETPQGAPKLIDRVTMDPKTNGGKRAEVSVKGITGGTYMLSPNAPGGGTMCDIELRTTLGAGDSGVYTYGIFSHPASYGAMGVSESRFIAYLTKRFDWISVDKDRNMLACAPADWGTGVVVHAKEQRIMSQGAYKNSVEHKYSYNAVQYKIPAYGWSSTKDHVGVYFINPTIEYLSGGASKQELVCHYHDDDNPDPIILDYWRGTHYGGGASCNMNAGEEWSKVVGPIFIYCNTVASPKEPSKEDLDTLAKTAGNPAVPAAWTDNATELWQDALAQAKKERAAWPYDWVSGVDYPHKAERGGAAGQIVLVDPQAATTELPHLTVGLAHPDYERGGRGGIGGGAVDWTHDAKFYQFWADGKADGKFAINDVRPGKYTLHAFADGVLGELAKADITVEAGKVTDLARIEWKPMRYGKQLWDIGYPDRTGSKFYKGDGDNYWLWGWCVRYPLLFPNDVNYTIGKSDYRKDWFFEQVPHCETTAWLNPTAKDPANQRFGWVKAESMDQYPHTNTHGPWDGYGRGRATTWTINFDLPADGRGVATFRLALAGADGQGGLDVSVNGTDAGTIRTVGTNALRYNTNKSVWYQYIRQFDGKLLKAGANKMQLTVPAGELTSGVVYDYLRLELDENATLPPPEPAAGN